MADITITDNLGTPVTSVPLQLDSVSAFQKYVVAGAAHFIVAPDFISRAGLTLSKAAPQPISFNLKIGHKFDLGIVNPDITITPGGRAVLRANATAGTNLLDGGLFGAPIEVPSGAGYISLLLSGSLAAGLTVSQNDFSFGFQVEHGITFEYWKAFPLYSAEPTLGMATGQVISDYIIPARLDDLKQLPVNDICTVSGEGSITVSADFSVSLPVNPLVSVALPAPWKQFTVTNGVAAGLSASFAISGSYQIRIRKTTGTQIELGFYREKSTKLTLDLSASAGITAVLGKTELIGKVIGTISPEHFDAQTLGQSGLTASEIDQLTQAIKDGLDRSLQASFDDTAASSVEEEAAFLYSIDLDQLDAPASEAVQAALHANLSALTRAEDDIRPDGTLLPGIKLRKSILVETKRKGATLHLNLFGLLNFSSVSELLSKSEILTDPASGDLTIHETVSGTRISAIIQPFDQQDALRKAMFNSILVTVAYRAAQVVSLPELASTNFHFALNQNTNTSTIRHYLDWFIALQLVGAADCDALTTRLARKGLSTCVVRTQLNDKACTSLFLDDSGSPYPKEHYLEIGRKALAELLDPDNSSAPEIEKRRLAFLQDLTRWKTAVQWGPVPDLGKLLDLSSTDPLYTIVLQDVRGDVYDIIWWADSMSKTAVKLQTMRAYLSQTGTASLQDPHFQQLRDDLQKHLTGVIAKSKLRFDEPFGLVALFLAAKNAVASGRLVTTAGILEKQPVQEIAAGNPSQAG